MSLAVFTSPGPLLFQLGPFSLRWYGLLIAIAVLCGLALATRLGKERGIDSTLIADLLPLLVLAAVVGARIYYVSFEWRQYRFNWLDALAIWRGGIAIHGALIGGTLAVILYSRWRKIAFWNLLDVLLPSVALGQAIGRWGNFFNSEAFGLPTDLPWKLTIPFSNRPVEFLDQSTFHPTFLYESIWNLGVLLLLLWLFRKGIEGQINSNDSVARQLLQDSLPKLRATLAELYDQQESINLSLGDKEKSGSESEKPDNSLEVAIDLLAEEFALEDGRGASINGLDVFV